MGSCQGWQKWRMSRWFVLKLSMFPTSSYINIFRKHHMDWHLYWGCWLCISRWVLMKFQVSGFFPLREVSAFKPSALQWAQQRFKKVIPSSFVDLQFESKMNQSTLCCLNTSHIFFLGGVSSRFQPMPKQLWELAPKSHVSGTCVSDHQNCLRMRWKTMACAQRCSAQFASTISTSSMRNSWVSYTESAGDEFGADVSGGSKEVDGKNEAGINCSRFLRCAGWCCG